MPSITFLLKMLRSYWNRLTNWLFIVEDIVSDEESFDAADATVTIDATEDILGEAVSEADTIVSTSDMISYLFIDFKHTDEVLAVEDRQTSRCRWRNGSCRM